MPPVAGFADALDVFTYDGVPSSYATGTAPTRTLTQDGEKYPDSTTEPIRSNPDPCPESNWIKYDVGEDWTSSGSGGAN